MELHSNINGIVESIVFEEDGVKVGIKSADGKTHTYGVSEIANLTKSDKISLGDHIGNINDSLYYAVN